MDKRTAQVLESAVQEFIDTGEPISSGWLYNHYNFGIKPAMIRLELEKLSGGGFLEQPHHSAGRIPTDKGYEFFAERVLESEKTQEPAHMFYRHIRNLFGRGEWLELLNELSSNLGLLGVADDLRKKMVYKEGLENLIENFEWTTQEEIKSVIRDFAEIDNRLNQTLGELENENTPHIFIGRKSPVTKSESLAVVAGNYENAGSRVLLLAIGPKRMDYKKTLKVFKNLYQ